MMTIAENRIDRESLHIFWKTWETSVKFSGKAWVIIGFHLYFWKMYFWKSDRRDGQTDSPDILRLIDMDMLLMVEKGIREGFIGKGIY